MSEFINAVRQASDGSLTGVSDAVILALIVVGGLLVIASIVALAISISLPSVISSITDGRTVRAKPERKLQERYWTETDCRRSEFRKTAPSSSETVTAITSKRLDSEG